MITQELIRYLHVCTQEFANRTNALDVDFADEKKRAIWSLKYNIIKFEFILTKKEKIVCPKHTLFCRVYFGKNEMYYFHLPELMSYLEPDNFQCYYYPYIESTERLEACFAMLSDFLYRNYFRINELAKSIEGSEKIKADKLTDMLSVYLSEVPEKELEADMWQLYEDFVLLLRYTAEGAYRALLLGNYEVAFKQYVQMEKKGQLTAYEKRLYGFLQAEEGAYEILPEACNGLKCVKQWDNPNKEGLSILLMGLVYELVFGVIFSVIIAGINAVLGDGAVYYAGVPWGVGFVFAGPPAVFGGIAHRNLVRRLLEKDNFEEGLRLEKMINPSWIEPFSRIIFGITFVGCFVVNIQVAFCTTSFYDTYLSFDKDEDFFGRELVSCEYGKLENVYYSKGLYNVYGDYIGRPSYLLEFEDGIVWNSDGFMEIEAFEKNVLPILEDYYDEIIYVEARNDLIED